MFLFLVGRWRTACWKLAGVIDDHLKLKFFQFWGEAEGLFGMRRVVIEGVGLFASQTTC